MYFFDGKFNNFTIVVGEEHQLRRDGSVVIYTKILDLDNLLAENML